MPIDHIVIDVEIQKTIEETPGGWEATDKLGVSVAVIYEYLTDRYRIYGPADIYALQERLLRAERISGYNIWKFDFPVIFGLPGRERVYQLAPITNDILRNIWIASDLDPDTFNSSHKGWSLNNVAKSTLGYGKSGYGGDAPKWFQAGNWPKLVDYCIDDVRIERDLTDFIDKYGYIRNDYLDKTVFMLANKEKSVNAL